MDKVSTCQRLVEIYYKLISWEHHKSRDQYFRISLEFSPFREPKYLLQHNGYCHEFSEEVTVNEDPFVKFSFCLYEAIKSAVDLRDNRDDLPCLWGTYGLKELYEEVPEWESLVKEAQTLKDFCYEQ